jgi:peptidoglycan/LPS O-acetylase OafA/YrhL
MNQADDAHRLMPQLDSLRALAFAAVALHHWLPRGFDYPLVSGVHLFFVLSGFLITGILLDARRRNEAIGLFDLGSTLKAFYLRRFLRIVPLYVAALIVVAYFNIAGIRGAWMWHTAYLTNFHIFFKNEWIGLVGHFWTLSVEEQFYLAWPLLVLWLPWRVLPALFLSVAAGSVAFRWVGEVFFPGRLMWNLLTPGYLDSFALGAFLAHHHRVQEPIYTAVLRRGGMVIAVCFALAVLRKRAGADWHLVFLDPLLFAIAYMCVINIAANGARGALGWILNQPLLRYAGRISYGLYIAHNFAPLPVGELLARYPGLQTIPRIQLVLMAMWTMLVAMLSWHCFEAPINGLKKYFPYSRRRVASGIQADVATAWKSSATEA